MKHRTAISTENSVSVFALITGATPCRTEAPSRWGGKASDGSATAPINADRTRTRMISASVSTSQRTSARVLSWPARWMPVMTRTNTSKPFAKEINGLTEYAAEDIASME